jgi:hypothetical protein
MNSEASDLAKAIEPVVAAIGGTVVPIEDIEEGDIPLEWDGAPALAVRLDEVVSLERMIETVEQQLGGPLSELDRSAKQQAVRLLDDRGAFRLRRSIEEVGEAMGVSRITIYNYLSAIKEGA